MNDGRKKQHEDTEQFLHKQAKLWMVGSRNGRFVVHKILRIPMLKWYITLMTQWREEEWRCNNVEKKHWLIDGCLSSYVPSSWFQGNMRITIQYLPHTKKTQNVPY